VVAGYPLQAQCGRDGHWTVADAATALVHVTPNGPDRCILAPGPVSGRSRVDTRALVGTGL